MRQRAAKQNPKGTFYGRKSGVRSLNLRHQHALALTSNAGHNVKMVRSPLILVFLLWCAGLGAAAQFSKLSLVFPQLETIYGGGQSTPLLGFLVSLISVRGIIFGLTAGLIVARVGFRKMLLAALALGVGISLLEAAIPPLPAMLALRLLEGASHLIIVVAAPTLIAQITATRFLPVAMTLWSTFFGVAYALTAWFGEPLVATHGVPSIFYVHAAWMLAIAALLFVVLPRDTPQETSRITNVLRQHLTIYSNPATAAPALAWLCYTLTYVSLLTVLPPLIAPEYRTLTIGLMPLAGIVTSMTIGVLLQRLLSPVPVVIIGFAIAAFITAGFFIAPASPVLCVALFASLGLVQGANFAAIPVLNTTATDRAHANGAVAQMGNLGNTFGTPIALGMIGVMGFGGLIAFTLAAYMLGIAAHIILGKMRN